MDQFDELRLQEQASAAIQALPLQPEVSNTQKALPSNWQSPIAATTNIEVLCGSSAHTGAAEFALDIQVGSGTRVYSAMSGQVIVSQYVNVPAPTPGNPNPTSYGHTIVIETPFTTANQNRVYRHRYAHLQDHTQLGVGVNVGFQQEIARSSNSGGVGYHLHFHIYNNSGNPVDASTMLGFRPNLSYPSNWDTCGHILPMSTAPIIIDAVAFEGRQQPRFDHFWFCYQGGHINECHLDAVPDNGASFNLGGGVYNPLSPRVYYRVRVPRSGYYRIWVCGYGVNPNGDSLHMGANNISQPISTDIAGFPASWAWRSIRMNGSVPLLALNAGLQDVDVWLREDGMRYNRIVLSDNTYGPLDPQNPLRCNSYP